MRASELEIGKKYYTNSYTGIIVVTLLEIIDEETALVKTKKSEPFKKSIKWLWETEEIAKKINEQFELEKDSIKEQLLEEIKGYITPVPTHYEWTRGDCPYDDSGELYVDGLVSLYQTIAEFLENEYTGEKEAVYQNRHGLSYETYGDRIENLARNIGFDILKKITCEYAEKLFNTAISGEDFMKILEKYNYEIYVDSLAFDFIFYERAIRFVRIANMKLSELVEK